MTEPQIFVNPLIKFDDSGTEGYWIDNTFYPSEDWDMAVTLAPAVKPFPDGTIIRTVRKNLPDSIYHKLEGSWYSSKLERPDMPWRQISINDQYMKGHPQDYIVLYEPEAK